jgi:uncharacterized heparinase superfamily protein
MRVRRYWTLWRTLPDEERQLRTARFVERVLRRRPAVRALRLAPDPPRARRFRRALRVPPDRLAAGLREADASRGPLFGDLEPRAAAVARDHPGHVRAVLESASRLLEGRIDLLGSGDRRPVRPDGLPDWHRDWKSGLAWPADRYHTDLTVVRGDGSDVKLPWELSRCQHLLVLGQAFRLAPFATDTDAARRLRAACAATARAHIEDWIRANPRGVGVNWTCAMEVAIRSVAWLAVLGLFRGAPQFDDAFLLDVARALWSHGRYIRCHLEVGSDGLTSNHYLADVAGLHALACGLGELRESEPWGAFARRALETEIERQVHPDGVDFERSLPYHRLVTEIFLHAGLLARAGGHAFSNAYHERLSRMLEFTASATRKDGSVPQWGDNDDGRWLPLDGYGTPAPHDHRHLLVLGGRFLGRDDLVAAGGSEGVEALWMLGPAVRKAAADPFGRDTRAFPDARYYLLRSADLHCAVPCGPVGTRGVGNHSHNDLFSVCVHAAGVEWIPDPGTGSYTGDPGLRDRLRSTSAHATLQLGTREQNALGEGLDGLFRLHERARPEVTAWRSDPEGARLEARHHGFASDGDRWVHTRSIAFHPRERAWLLSDELRRETGDRPAVEPAYLRFPLRPEIGVEVVDALDARLGALLDSAAADRAPRGSRCRWAARLAAEGSVFWIGLDLPADSRVGVESAPYSPSYGVTRPVAVVVATLPPALRAIALTALWSPGPP